MLAFPRIPDRARAVSLALCMTLIRCAEDSAAESGNPGLTDSSLDASGDAGTIDTGSDPTNDACQTAMCALDACGPYPDGCGGMLDCGGCTQPMTCGGAGVPGVCGDVSAHCDNSAFDPTLGESDVDCGGPCRGCAHGQSCADTSDCQRGSCDDGTCREGEWTTLAPMPTPRDYLAAVLGHDGRIYALGGFTEEDGAVDTVEVYDRDRDSWTRVAPLPSPRYGMSAVVGTDGKIYTVGGQFARDAEPDESVVLEVYAPDSDTWTRLTDLPLGRYQGAAVATGTGEIYAFAGFNWPGQGQLRSVDVYDLALDAWRRESSELTQARSSLAGVFAPDGNIYATGGASDLDVSGILEVHEPGTVGWHTLPAMPTARDSHACVVDARGRIIVIGGRDNGDPDHGSADRSLEVYDPIKREWSRLASSPRFRIDHAAVATPEGQVYIMGHVDDGIVDRLTLDRD